MTTTLKSIAYSLLAGCLFLRGPGCFLSLNFLMFFLSFFIF